MSMDRAISKCCSSPIAMEPLCLVGEAKTTFARVPVCTSCSRLLGDPRPQWGCPIKPMEKSSWGTSWMLMLEHRRERIGAPLYFLTAPDGVMVPEGYKELVKDEEPPF